MYFWRIIENIFGGTFLINEYLKTYKYIKNGAFQDSNSPHFELKIPHFSFPHHCIVKLSCPAGQNFEIIASKMLKTLVIGKKICKLRFLSSPHALLPNGSLI